MAEAWLQVVEQISRGDCIHCKQPIPFKVGAGLINMNYSFSLAGVRHRVCIAPVLEQGDTTTEEESCERPLRGRKPRPRLEKDIQVEWFDGHEIYMYRDRHQLCDAMYRRGVWYPRRVGRKRKRSKKLYEIDLYS